MAGAFGVFGYMVEERRHEIGIRVALGAGMRQVAMPVFGLASRALVSGLAAGLLLSFIAMPLLGHFLYGLDPFDPVAFAQVAAIIAVAAGLATYVPVWRAAKVNPAVTLRRE